MSAFVGVVSLSGALSPEPSWREGLEQALCPSGSAVVCLDAPGAFLLQDQPCLSRPEDRAAVLLYDGELTNRRELAGQLGLPGSCPDQGVILGAWRKWGTDFPKQLRGAFALALWDGEARCLLLARDGLGIRPLFYARRGELLLFASTLPLLLAHPAVEPILGPEGIYEILLLGPGRATESGVFRDVAALEPGQQGLFSEGETRLEYHWQLWDDSFSGSFEDCARQVRELVTDSVKGQLALPGRVCGFLSGGLDSSIVCTIAKRELGTLDTRNVDYRDNDRYFQAGVFQPGADGPYVLQMAEYLGSRHQTVILDTESLAQALGEAVRARGLPGMADVDSSLLLFARQTAGSFDAALSGECADEIFGGYPWYRSGTIEGFPWARNTAQRAAYLRPEWTGWMRPEDYVNGKFQQALDRVDLLPDTPPEDRRIRQMMALNLRWFMPTLVDRNDRMGRAAGLNLRAPFANPEIAQYLYTVPWAYKAWEGREKGLLRYAFQDLLPQEIAWRKKSPYPKTWNPGYRAAVTALLREELAQPDCPLPEFLRPEALEALLTEDRSLPWYGQLMTTPQTIAYFWQMAHWMRTFRVRIAA